MLCPKCQNTMREREKGEVVIDVCPGCQGVWLDRGELEKLVASEESYYGRAGWEEDGDGEHDDRRRRESYDARGRRPARRRSFLSNIFEGFGEEDD
jgi:Zn-finger nucleic acid-binding protein